MPDYLSATQIKMFLRCPRQYAFRYLEKRKVPPTGALMQGRAWHDAIAHNYRQKVKSKKDLKPSVVEEVFADVFGKITGAEEWNCVKDETPGGLLDQGIVLTRAHTKEIAPKVQPWLVEEKFEVSLGADFPWNLLGFWDVVDSKGFVRDNKSSGKSPNQNDLDKDIQMGLYDIAYRIKFGKAPKGLCHDCVVKTKVPKSVFMQTSRTKTELQWLAGMLEGLGTAIKGGSFYPNPTGWWCSPTWCGYYELCRKRR